VRSIYYAHCLAIYGTRQETRDVNFLESLGYRVVNPNTREVTEACERFRRGPECGHKEPIGAFCVKCELWPWTNDVSAYIMEHIFKPMVQRCDALAFRSLPGGAIPAGVNGEITWAAEVSLPVFEIPSFAGRKILTVAETRDYLREVGQR
jgi:hypothetical protein